MAQKKSQTQVRKEAVEKKRQRQNRLRLLGGGLVGLVLLGIAIFSFVQTQLPTAEVCGCAARRRCCSPRALESRSAIR